MTRISIKIALAALSLPALSLVGVSAWMSINGMAVLFPGDPGVVIWLGASLQGAKLTAAGHVAQIGRRHRIFVLVYMLVIALINAVSAYGYLAHAGMTEASPIVDIADMLNIDEKLIRWVIADAVACIDVVAIAVLVTLADWYRTTFWRKAV